MLLSITVVINSHLGSISHRFQDTATYRLKRSTENCRQTAADGYMVTIDSLYGSCQRHIQWYDRRPLTIHRLATIPHDWHTIVHYNPSRLSKVNNFHVI